MGHPTNLRTIPRDCKFENGSTTDRSVSPCIRQGTKFRDMLISEKPDLSYAHFHQEITRGPDDALPKHLKSQHGQGLDTMTLKENGVVKYMSKVPSYLEKGKNFQDKALNVGVIDWKRLEKWKCSQRQMPHKYTGYSPYSSNTSLFSTDCSSSHSCRDQSHSPARLTMSSFSLQSPPEASKKENCFQDAKSLAIRAFQEGERKGTELNSDTCDVVASLKGKIKLQGDGPAKEAPRLGETKSNSAYREKSEYNYVEGLSPSKNDTRLNLHRTKVLHSPSKVSSNGVKAPQTSYLLPFPARRFSSPSRSRNTEEKRPVAGLRVVSATKSLEELDVKARNPSPIRRLSFAVSKMIKNVGSRESSPLPRSSSTDGVAKSLPERPLSNSRGRSSPLRRLFDPLLKPKGSNSPEPSKKHSSPEVDSMKIKPRCSRDLHSNSNNGSSSLQALLQVSFKNELPLFTFATDNESNILASTVRKSYVPGKGQYTWTYTFFTVREIKRKSGIWLNNNQGGKGDGNGYVPNVVAQVKVSDSHEKAGNIITREFDLFAVDIGRHGDQSETDFHPTNELAAIVMKLPISTSGSRSKDGQSTYSWLDLPLHEPKDSSDNLRNPLQSSNFSSTVILPGGIHTIPSRGEISRLAQRWRSGGLCDCGGWDLGCQLRVYTNQIGYETKMGSTATSRAEHKFQLFSQAGQDNQQMLSLAPFKERIYSVEFSSSLSFLQAFAICISFIDSARPAELSGPSIDVEKMGVFEAPRQLEVPARYISCPPHSPVGRV